jgi:hypothetical protein
MLSTLPLAVAVAPLPPPPLKLTGGIVEKPPAYGVLTLTEPTPPYPIWYKCGDVAVEAVPIMYK